MNARGQRSILSDLKGESASGERQLLTKHSELKLCGCQCRLQMSWCKQSDIVRSFAAVIYESRKLQFIHAARQNQTFSVCSSVSLTLPSADAHRTQSLRNHRREEFEPISEDLKGPVSSKFNLTTSSDTDKSPTCRWTPEERDKLHPLLLLLPPPFRKSGLNSQSLRNQPFVMS